MALAWRTSGSLPTAGGSFTIDFTAPVDLTIFNSEGNRGNNFDDDSVGGTSATVAATSIAGSAGWSYTVGAANLDLTSIVGGLTTDTFTIGNARIFTGAGTAGSGAP